MSAVFMVADNKVGSALLSTGNVAAAAGPDPGERLSLLTLPGEALDAASDESAGSARSRHLSGL